VLYHESDAIQTARIETQQRDWRGKRSRQSWTWRKHYQIVRYWTPGSEKTSLQQDWVMFQSQEMKSDGYSIQLQQPGLMWVAPALVSRTT